ncbi:MAG: sulfite exporter TauE/SafE family protein [Lachnospiraceae bacterium]|nr:sulfite exporter TauE/SafE family protein [Lachnospiraceae bacterium]
MSKTIHLNIGGMTCVNCQDKIEKTLKSTEGVISAGVSYNNGTANIAYNEEKISLKRIVSVIEGLDYEVILHKEAASPDLVSIISMLVLIVALYVCLQSLGILNRLVPSQLADVGMGYGMLFVIGLITSVHCIAMCGGINLSQCIPQKTKSDPSNDSKFRTFLPALSYNLGRVCSYTAVGFVLGLIGFLIGRGAEVGLSSLLQGILKIIAGLFMVVMGINMLGLFPWLRKFTIRMPRFLARKIGTKRAKASRPFIVGILNGFMPCGPLQSMWIVALAAGNPFAGALSMFLFSVGTVPLMLGLGSIVSAIGKKFADKVMTVGAVLVVVLGLAMLSQGGSLSGWLPPDLLLALIIAFCMAGVILSLPIQKKAMKYVSYAASVIVIIGAYVVWNYQGLTTQRTAVAENGVEIVDGVQVVNSTLEAGHYPNITVQVGIPVRWVVDAPEGSINGCNYRMLIQDYEIEHTFQTGENIIEFMPVDTGTVRYSCWMGMIYGNIFVTDGTGETTKVINDVSDSLEISCCD